MEIALAILCGVAIGSILGFIGAGGSMVAVPMLIYLFDMTPVQATTASLIIVFSGALSGVLSKFKSRDVLVRESLSIWAIGLATNFGGAYILPKISDSIILTGFSIVLVAAGVSMLLKPPSESSERRMPLPALIGLSLLVGALTGLFGIGGGFIAIPILVLFYNVSPAKAAGTSLFIITINTLTGFFAHYRHWDDVSWEIPLVIAITAILISRLAAKLSTSVSPQSLKRAFAYTVFVIASFTLIETWLF